MAYATVQDLTEFLDPDPVPAAAGRLLERATELVDEMLTGAWYDTDGAGNPTDPDVMDALKRAVCAQVQYTVALADETGANANVSQMRVGTVHIYRALSLTGPGTPRHAPQAVTILRNAGLLPVRAITGWLAR